MARINERSSQGEPKSPVVSTWLNNEGFKASLIMLVIDPETTGLKKKDATLVGLTNLNPKVEAKFLGNCALNFNPLLLGNKKIQPVYKITSSRTRSLKLAY